MTSSTIRFKGDAARRRRLMTPEAFAHPAKGHLGMWQEMIERYSKVGDTVLDPMGGIGTTLIAALMGRDVICVELESHFILPMRASWEKMRNIPMLGYTMGHVVILRGDARTLPLQSADCVITSPPYGDEREGGGIRKPGHPDGEKKGLTRWGYTQPAAIITSPPYEEGLGHQGSVQREILRTKKIHGGSRAYTELTHPDCILTSPPYDNRLADKYDDGDKARMQYFLAGAVSSENIGNMRGERYWQAMSLIYQECHRVLSHGGIMVLVLKGFTRDGKYIDLPGQTEAMLLEAGWVKHDHWRRELWGLSFWRILQKRKDPEAFDDRLNFEEVIAFKKPGPILCPASTCVKDEQPLRGELDGSLTCPKCGLVLPPKDGFLRGL